MIFNLNSGVQLQQFLFEFLELKPIKEKNDKGNYSVAEDILTHYAEKEDIEFCKLLINIRKLRKAKNTYAKGFRRATSEEDKQIHPSFNLHTVKTYRSSSSEPNFQNVPKHGEIIPGVEWQEIRKIFTRKELWEKYHCGEIELDLQNGLIGEVDYVGAEVKVAAAESDDDQLIDDLNNGFDQHSHWAGVLFGINKPIDEIKALHKDERFLAKNNFTFANLFGAGNTSIAEEMRKSDFYVEFVKKAFQKAKQVKGFNTTWNEFFKSYSEQHISECQGVFYKRYKGVKDWQDWVVRKYYDVGYVENAFGFRRRYPMKRNEIINFPIQSTSFHLLLHSLIVIEKKMRELDLRSQLVGQIHDSGYFNIYKPEAEQVMDLVEYEMTHKPWDWIKKVNLEAEVELGEVWYNLKLENKLFKATHIPSGEVFKEKFLHGFASDMGMNVELISKILAGKKDKEDKPYSIPQWEFKYE